MPWKRSSVTSTAKPASSPPSLLFPAFMRDQAFAIIRKNLVCAVPPCSPPIIDPALFPDQGDRIYHYPGRQQGKVTQNTQPTPKVPAKRWDSMWAPKRLQDRSKRS